MFGDNYLTKVYSRYVLAVTDGICNLTPFLVTNVEQHLPLDFERAFELNNIECYLLLSSVMLQFTLALNWIVPEK